MSNKDMKKGKTKKIHISPLVIVLFVVLFLYSISLLLLLGWGLLSSLKNHLDFGTPTYNVLGFPILEGKINSREELFQLKNYRFIIENFHFRPTRTTTPFWNKATFLLFPQPLQTTKIKAQRNSCPKVCCLSLLVLKTTTAQSTMQKERPQATQLQNLCPLTLAQLQVPTQTIAIT